MQFELLSLVIPFAIIVCICVNGYCWLKHPEDLFGDDDKK